MNNIQEKYKEILDKKFSGAGGIDKKYVVIVFDKNNIYKINEFAYDTEEEATIAYAKLLKGEMYRDDVLLTIRYCQSW